MTSDPSSPAPPQHDRPPTVAAPDAELALHRINGLVSVFHSLIRWAGIVLIARYGFLAIESLSGQTTLADVGIAFLGDVNVSIAIAWVAAIGGIAYGWRQRKLRKDTVERLCARIAQLEKTIGNVRSSSHLTARGETRPEDQP